MEENVKLKESPFTGQQEKPSALITYLYIGHFLARWGARMWEFSVGLYMINIWPESLLYAAIYGAVESAAIAVFGPIIGRWVDKLSCVRVLKLWLVTQNLSFVIAGGSVVALLVHSSLKSTNFSIFILLVIIINVCGGIGVLSTLAVISEDQPPELLTKMNSVTRRIDLSCKLLVPVISGFIISFVSLKASAITLALWTTVSVWVEYWLFTSVYHGIPALVQSSQRRMERLIQCDMEMNNQTMEKDSLLPVTDDGSELADRKARKKISERILEIPYIAAWRVYLQQEVVLPGLALALLFFTVLRVIDEIPITCLSFGTLMTATLEWEGIPEYIIGISRGISAVIGIAATVVYPVLQSRISTIRTGLWSIWSQWSFLLPCVAAIWIQNGFLSSYILMGSVAISRLGLWMFDLSDLVSESDRLIVGGVQNSLQSLMDLLAYVMGIIISDPRDFWKLTTISFLAVTLAAFLYCIHTYHARKHLFHFDQVLWGKCFVRAS
ncbi:Solute carrier family 40 member 1 [Glycine max]|nr:Solute carrier family 40 member 1 [Glycine max]